MAKTIVDFSTTPSSTSIVTENVCIHTCVLVWSYVNAPCLKQNNNKFSGSLCNDLKRRVPTLCRGADVAQGDGAREEDPERESHAVDGAKGGGGSVVSGRLNVGHSFPHALSLMENLVKKNQRDK